VPALAADRDEAEPAPTTLRFGARAQVIDRLDASSASCAVWRRHLPKGLSTWLDGLVFPMPRQGRWQLAPDTPLAPTVRTWLGAWLAGVAAPDPRWVDDIATLLALARRGAGRMPLAVRLDVVANDGCRLFHVDRLRVRWICTYRGAGTQWLEDGAVDRGGLGRGSNAHVLDWRAIGQFEAGWFAAMRGDRWPGAQGRGFVHRSPPASAAAPRIVLAIDANGD
jgi:hypothetical protein